MIKGILKELVSSGKDSIRKQITLQTSGNKVVLLVNVTTLKDENGEFMGTVVVFDDLTQLLKAQRMAAWREVARRIAHEIKNPLTPIQLSAQRLRRRYLDSFDDDDSVFDECTGMIIKQVDDLKNLVNEFSSFARMPASNPSPNNLNEVVGQALVLFQEGHKEINFQVNLDPKVPIFSLDHEQIRRVVINFSTKKSGTGLGLAIVSTIISDHNGYIRVRDNEPRGTHFIVELPITTDTEQA